MYENRGVFMDNRTKNIKIFKELIKENQIKVLYNENHRFFHTIEHLKDGFYSLDEKEKNEITAEQIYAWVFHDIIYEIPSFNGSNEKRSSDYMKKFMQSKNIHDVDLNKVSKIIIDTIEHKPSIEESKLIMDMDLISLSFDYKKFIFYRKKVSKEYLSYYSSSEVIKGTIKFTENMLSMKRIFNTDRYFEEREELTRINLIRYRKELMSIK